MYEDKKLFIFGIRYLYVSNCPGLFPSLLHECLFL